MSIKLMIKDELNNIMVGIETDTISPSHIEVLAFGITQQIISEIVGELEKIRQIYSGDTNAITLCIETIKKMGGGKYES